ncbi:hypothetical protein FPOAC2_00516 [Fusarium poae]|jgi:hypothetical protein|uniref:hypothetical protein n=1 Tax=Fusarium poae TaxID=36050 RepID=UPI001CE8E523|nr:hypothetical protein FPOAC1_000458 [Fusarium poae]KAG8674490.1 hypothetical protein FPOAC1_000458 [Fusarium poae]
MDRLANQGQSEGAGVGDLAKDMQDASASASPAASSTPGDGSGNTGKSGSEGMGDSNSGDSDSDSDAVQFDAQLFKEGPVFIVDSSQRSREVGFEAGKKTVLEKVAWQVVVDTRVETLGSSNFKSSKGDYNQFLDVTNNMVLLNFMGDTAKFYNNTMYVQIDWSKDGSNGYTKTQLFTVTNSTGASAFKELTDDLKAEQAGQGPAEVTLTSDASSTSGSTKATGTIEPSGNDSSSSSGGGGGGLSTGATAGIAVGAVIGGLLLIGALVWFLLRRRRRNKQPSEEYTIQQSYAVDKEISGRASDSPNSPYSDENHMQPIALGNVDRDRGAAPTPPPGRSSVASHDRGANSGAQTPQGMSANVAHLVEDGMTADEIRRLEEEERQLDDEIERAARR